ncbi:MAG: hypothetical protein ACR2M6_04255, partial [Vampirovibrionia bacterium]
SNTRERSKTDKRHKKSDEKKGPVNSQNKSARPEQKRNRSNKETNETNPKEDKQDLIFQNKYLILATCTFLLFIGFVAGRFSNSTKPVTPPNLINRTELDRVTKENKELLEEKQKLGGLIKDVEKLNSQKIQLEELLATKEAQLIALEKTQSESLKISDIEEKKTEYLGKDQMKSNLLALQEKSTSGKSIAQAADHSADQPRNTPSEITSFVVVRKNNGGGGIRRPLFVEVRKNEIILMPNDFDYKNIFKNEKPIKIPASKIADDKSFEKLLNYVKDQKAKSGPLRRRRDTIITFLIRPDGVTTYNTAKNVVNQFESKYERELAIIRLNNGDYIVESLSGKAPLVLNSDGPTTVRPPTPKDVPRKQDGAPLLSKKEILITGGKVIPKVIPEAFKNQVKDYVGAIVSQNKIEIEDGRYITDEKKVIELIDEFNKKPLQNEFFELKLLRLGPNINVEMIPKENCGENPEHAVKGIFNKIFGDRLLTRQWYLSYLVEPDSFETYIAMREFTDSEGYFAGWTIINPGDRRTQQFSVGYNVGAKPPPRKPGPPTKRTPRPVNGVLD